MEALHSQYELKNHPRFLHKVAQDIEIFFVQSTRDVCHRTTAQPVSISVPVSNTVLVTLFKSHLYVMAKTILLILSIQMMLTI